VHVLLGMPDPSLDVGGADDLRRAVVVAVAGRHAAVIVDMVLTAVEGSSPRRTRASRPAEPWARHGADGGAAACSVLLAAAGLVRRRSGAGSGAATWTFTCRGGTIGG
jgi:hypothetical protein